MQSVKGKLYLTGAFSLAGTSVVTGYLLSAKLSGFSVTAVSMAIVIAGLLPFYAAQAWRTVRRFTRRDCLMLISQAVFGIVLFRVFLLLGVRRTSTAEAGILTGATPAITAVMAYYILREHLSWFAIAGITATIAGIVLLQGDNLFSAQFSAGHLLGNALILCAVASESTFDIIARKYKAGEHGNAPPIHPMVQTLLVSAVAFAFSVIPALLEHPIAALASLDVQEWLALIWYGLVVTALAFAFFYAGARRCNAYTIAAFSGMMPLTSMLLSLFLLHEQVLAVQWIGSALILAGMSLIGQKQRRATC